MTNIYTLLIGINDYPVSPLNGCTGDVKKMEAYFNELNKEYKFNLIQKKLLNTLATKDGIVKEIQKILKKLKDDDCFVMYYSGHGTREISKDRFLDDYNGVLECIVPCFTKGQTTGILLADKELRYLLNQCNVKAHILGIFDSCHSGDITRTIAENKQVKRMAYKFPQRPYEEFIFSKEIEEKQFKDKSFSEIVPDQNIMTISGCQPFQLSWEDSKGGVFTRNLLSVLKNSNHLINYNDLVKSVETSIRHTTREKQTPTLSVQGSRAFNQMTSWLRLNGDQLKSDAGFITYNPKRNMGWVFSKGKLMGVSKKSKIKLPLNGEIMDLETKRVNLSDTILNIPRKVLSKLDITKNYPVNSVDYFSPARIHISDLDNNTEVAEQLITTLKPKRTIQLVDSWDQADFELNIFNNTIYYSFPNDPYRPLNRQLSLKKPDGLKKYLDKSLAADLNTLKKWQHFLLQEKHEGFNKAPIKIEINQGGEKGWTDLTNGALELVANKDRSPDGRWFQQYDLRITNLTSAKLFITPLVLFNGKLEISSYPFEEQTRPLNENTSIEFKNFIVLDYYEEVYNWKAEMATFKIIVTSDDDLTQSIPYMIQSGFDDPITHMSLQRGGGLSLKMPNTGWGIYTRKVSLANPDYDKTTGMLDVNMKWYKENEVVWPFIQKLYPDID